MLFPRKIKVLDGFFVVTHIGVENGSVEIHFFELEDILAVVPIFLHSIQFFPLFLSEFWLLFEAIIVLSYNALLDFDLVYVWDYLDAHRTLILGKIKMFLTFISGNDT